MLTLLLLLAVASTAAALGLIAGEDLCDALAFQRDEVPGPARVLAALAIPAIAVIGTIGCVLRQFEPEDARGAVADLWEIAVYGESS